MKKLCFVVLIWLAHLVGDRLVLCEDPWFNEHSSSASSTADPPVPPSIQHDDGGGLYSTYSSTSTTTVPYNDSDPENHFDCSTFPMQQFVSIPLVS